MTRLLCIVASGVAFLAGAQEPGPVLQVTALNPLVRVQLDRPVEGMPTAELFAARGEYESFQAVITAQNGTLSRANAQMQPLTNASGAVLDPSNVTLYGEVFVPVRHPAPRATCPPGLIPDPLVPFKNPYTGEPVPEPVWEGNERVGPRFGAANFDLFTGHNAVIWVDVFVPTDAAPGVYEGALQLTAGNAPSVELPVRLTVWDFALPPGPTHENHFGGFERVVAYHKIDQDSDAWRIMEDRYIEMMADHRINPPIPKRLMPAPAEDGTPQFSDELTAQWADFIKRYNITNVQVPKAPFGEDRQKTINFYRGWYAFLEKNGWASGGYLYMLDEPNDAEEYERVRQLGAVVQEAEPRLRRLVVEQPYIQNPEWGTLDQAIDIWCPLFGFIDEAAIAGVQANGDDVWSYTALVQTAPPYHPDYEQVRGWTPPFWQLDFPPISYRIPTWLNRRYNVTGLLYWSTVYWGSPERNPWDDPGFRIRWNGDGFLFYPGADAGIDGPVASIRLKNLRDGMEDYELFVLLEARKGGEALMALIREAVPDWGHTTDDPAKLLDLRRRMGEAIADTGSTAGVPTR